jgi:alkylhydroperoxidase/carboxymuconolactone decarboxylase family protein YurZ
MKVESSTSQTPLCDQMKASGQWNSLWNQLFIWDSTWTEQFVQMAFKPWLSNIIPPKYIELICIAGDAACTHMYEPGTRRHIQGALKFGASQEEIFEVLKLGYFIGIQTLNLGGPILAEELARAGIIEKKDPVPLRVDTPVCNQLRADGQWDPLWDTIFDWDPSWTEQFLEMGTSVWRNGILPPKYIELICIAVNGACTHLYGPGVRHHIRAALKLGATKQEVLEVLKFTSILGIHSCNLGVPILAEELTVAAKSI